MECSTSIFDSKKLDISGWLDKKWQIKFCTDKCKEMYLRKTWSCNCVKLQPLRWSLLLQKKPLELWQINENIICVAVKNKIKHYKSLGRNNKSILKTLSSCCCTNLWFFHSWYSKWSSDHHIFWGRCCNWKRVWEVRIIKGWSVPVQLGRNLQPMRGTESKRLFAASSTVRPKHEMQPVAARIKATVKSWLFVPWVVNL